MIDPFLIKGFSYSSFYISNNKGFFFVAFQLLSETNATSFLLLQSILQSKSPLWLFICWLLEFSFQKIIFINYIYCVFFIINYIFVSNPILHKIYIFFFYKLWIVTFYIVESNSSFGLKIS